MSEWDITGRQAAQPQVVALSLSDLDQVVRKDLGEVLGEVREHREQEVQKDRVKEKCEAALVLVFIAGGFVLYAVRMDFWIPFLAGLPSMRGLVVWFRR